MSTDLTSTVEPAGAPDRAASIVAEVFAPWVLVAMLPFLVALGPGAPGEPLARFGWAAVIAVSCAGGPMGVLLVFMRRGRITSGHHVRERTERTVPLLVALLVVVAGVASLHLGHAPADLRALVWAMLAGLVVTVGITAVWKISVHVAVAAGWVTILVLVHGPVPAIGVLLVALVAWSRIRTTDHTPAQAAAGAFMGATVAGAVFTAMS